MTKKYRQSSKELNDLKANLNKSVHELDVQMAALNQASIVAMTDEKGVITYVNEKFMEISGYSREELIGKTHNVVKSDTHTRKFFQDLWRTISAGKVWKGEMCNRKKDAGLYWVDTTIVPFLDENNRPYQYVAIRTDISEKKRNEQLLRVERERLAHSEKMASLGVMASGIAHEIGNPLGALRGRLEMLEMQVKQGNLDPEKVASTVEVGISLVDRINRIVKGLRAYARDGSMDEMASIHLNELVDDILELCHEKATKYGVEIKKGRFEKSVVKCRESEVGQVLVNLINNSFDAIKDLPERWLEVEVWQEDQYFCFSVGDSGSGVPEELQKNIFDPFFTTKPVGQGTGLGLSICATILHSHGGEFIYDKESKHTRFVAKLPRSGKDN